MTDKYTEYPYSLGNIDISAETAVDSKYSTGASGTAPKKRQNKNKSGESRIGSVLMMIFISVLACCLLGGVIYSLDKRNATYNRLSSLKNELKLAEAENARLQSELDSQMSAKNVEAYAEDVLGMKKIDPSQIEYIKTNTGDVVSIPEKEDNIFTKVKKFFDDCVEYFKG